MKIESVRKRPKRAASDRLRSTTLIFLPGKSDSALLDTSLDAQSESAILAPLFGTIETGLQSPIFI
jgi:hypothetical protein